MLLRQRKASQTFIQRGSSELNGSSQDDLDKFVSFAGQTLSKLKVVIFRFKISNNTFPIFLDNLCRALGESCCGAEKLSIKFCPAKDHWKDPRFDDLTSVEYNVLELPSEPRSFISCIGGYASKSVSHYPFFMTL